MPDEHPQPALDLLTSLPLPAEDSFLLNWDGKYPEKLDGERGETIREHPELWEFHELPDCLKELTPEDHVSFLVTPALNLNAIAIGLGLENIEYEPEKFAGLIYHTGESDAPVLCSSSLINADKAMIISVWEEPEPTRKSIVSAVNKINDFDLIDGLENRWEDDIETEKVAELISSES
mgnify:CR=1 FL=1